MLFIQQTKLIIDWHNYGYTIMMANKVNKLLCVFGKIYEMYFGKYADYNLTVSKAFKTDLSNKFAIPADTIGVLYDRAVQGKFKELSIEEKYEFFEQNGFGGKFIKRNSDDDGKVEYVYVKDRPLLLLTSTSYTPDEDLSILVSALEKYAARDDLPRVHLVVTGAGPQKKMYLQKFDEFNKTIGKNKV